MTCAASAPCHLVRLADDRRPFGEVTRIRANDDQNIERVVLAIAAPTLFVAGCSLAVGVAGSLLDRKRLFHLPRLAGTPLNTLTRVVVLESIVPLVGAVVVAAGIAVALAETPVRAVFTANLGPGQDSAAAAHPQPQLLPNHAGRRSSCPR
jgi:hypothetical protein